MDSFVDPVSPASVITIGLLGLWLIWMSWDWTGLPGINTKTATIEVKGASTGSVSSFYASKSNGQAVRCSLLG